MATPNQGRKGHPSTYFVQNRSSEEELERLQLQDQMLTTSMGGVLPEQTDLTHLRHVLDVGCGTGGWLIEIATTYPEIEALIGVDVSASMVAFARERAREREVSARVEFHVMDALRMLEFPRRYFDLINQRLGMSYLRTWDWPGLLQEYRRVCRPGGVIRVTESAMIVKSTSPALMQLNDLLLTAFQRAGHYFTNERDGVIGQLVPLLKQQGLSNVQAWEHHLDYRAGTSEGEFFAQDIAHAYRTLVPYLRKWTQVPNDYQTIYQQALAEMRQPEFVATWRLLTVWGTNPSSAEKQVFDPH